MKPAYLVIGGNAGTVQCPSYVSARQLVTLYGVNPADCVLVDNRNRLDGLREADFTVLTVRQDGRYRNPDGGPRVG